VISGIGDNSAENSDHLVEVQIGQTSGQTLDKLLEFASSPRHKFIGRTTHACVATLSDDRGGELLAWLGSQPITKGSESVMIDQKDREQVNADLVHIFRA
jgi:hypothetical protein